MILRSKFEEGKDLSSQHSLRPGTLLLYKLVFVGGPVLPRLMTSSEIKEGNGSPWGCLWDWQKVVAQETAPGDNSGTSCHSPHGHRTQKSRQACFVLWQLCPKHYYYTSVASSQRQDGAFRLEQYRETNNSTRLIYLYFSIFMKISVRITLY